MDQVITLLNGHIGFEGQEEQLTKTMINNYRKEDIISPMKGKRYSKDQIYQMLFVYYLKQAMPMADIKILLSSLENSDLQPLYSRFLREQQETKKAMKDTLSSKSVQSKEELAALLLQLSVAVSFMENISKNLVEHLEEKDRI